MTAERVTQVPPPEVPPAGLPRIRVVLVEDDPVQRGELLELLESDPGCQCLGAWGAAEEVLPRWPELEPDVALVDIGLPGLSGIELVNRLKALLPRTQFLMLTVVEDPGRVTAALAAGATGYLLKRDAPARLAEAVRELYAGGSPMSRSIAREVVESFRRPAGDAGGDIVRLSEREREVLDHLGAGLLYKEIAQTLDIGLGTVKTHIHRIYEKLHARNRSEAVAKGHRA